MNHTTASDTQIDGAPLVGIRILDVTHGVIGPTTTMVLAALGAQVIKIEPPFLTGHRALPQSTPHTDKNVLDEPWNRVPTFNMLNRGKLSCPVNLSMIEGITLFKNLVAISDVVIDNFSPRVMRNFGLDHRVLIEHNPSIISLAMSGFGANGPWGNRVGVGPSIDAITGITDLTGYCEGGPVRPGMLNPDLNGGLFGALAVLAALDYRYQSGNGQHIDYSMLEANLQFMGEAIVGVSGKATIDRRAGNRDSKSSVSGCYPSRDDNWVTIEIPTNETWSAVCEEIGDPEFIYDSRFYNEWARLSNREELDEVISQWTLTHNAEEIVAKLSSRGSYIGIVQSTKDILTDQHLNERNFFYELEETLGATSVYPRFGWLFSDIPMIFKTPAPSYGQHIDYILGELLGIQKDHIISLKETNTTPVQPYVGDQGSDIY